MFLYGFENARILKPFSNIYKEYRLNLIVDKKKDTESNPAELERTLSRTFNCKFEIIILDNILGNLKEQILPNCASISNLN